MGGDSEGTGVSHKWRSGQRWWQEDEVVCRARDKLTFSDFYCKTRGWEEGGKEG